jgi:hypothetical protein
VQGNETLCHCHYLVLTTPSNSPIDIYHHFHQHTQSEPLGLSFGLVADSGRCACTSEHNAPPPPLPHTNLPITTSHWSHHYFCRHTWNQTCYESQIMYLHSTIVDNYSYTRGIILVYSLNIFLSATGSGVT